MLGRHFTCPFLRKEPDEHDAHPYRVCMERAKHGIVGSASRERNQQPALPFSERARWHSNQTTFLGVRMKLNLEIPGDGLKTIITHITSPHVMGTIKFLAVVSLLGWVAWLVVTRLAA
jgi:hypothetical protein